jgi:ADP-heptose:LPS heptosyltransferase
MGVTAPGSIPLTRADILPEIHFTDDDQKWVDSLIQSHSPGKPEGVFRLALCPGARFKQKDWGLEKFEALLKEVSGPRLSDSLFGGRCLEVVLLGGGEDRARFLALAQKAPHTAPFRIWSLMGELNPRQAILFLRKCQACIGNDTFGLHAAIVAGTPSVVIMGGGDYGRWIPWANSDKHRMVFKPLPCQGCHWQCSQPDYDCIRQIPVNEVITELAQALGTQAGGPSKGSFLK